MNSIENAIFLPALNRMENIINEIRHLFSSFSNDPVIHIGKIPQSGSIRIYFRIRTENGSFIAAYGENRKENRAFILFSRHFKSAGCPVPAIYAVNPAETIYFGRKRL